MKLMELYNNIKNPLDDEEVLKKILEAYVNSSKYYIPAMQKNLMHSVEKLPFNIREEDINQFYSLVFNMWKKEIKCMSSDKIDTLFQNHEIGADFLDLRFYLIGIPDLFTEAEIDSFFNNEKNSEQRKASLAKYRWDYMTRIYRETRVWSRRIHFEGDFSNLNHALFINADVIDVHPFAIHFIEECESESLIYYFTFDIYDADSPIVIYSSTELLERYIEVLKRMKVKYPDLFEKFKTPPILTGKIDEKIGYGKFPSWDLHSETPEYSIIEDRLYYEVRSTILEEACEEASIKWILKNKDRTINSTPLIELFAFICTLEFLEDLKKRAEEEEKKEANAAKEQNRKVQMENIIKVLGYSKKEIASPVFQKSVYEIIRKYILGLLYYVSQNGYSSMPKITMTIREKQIAFTKKILDRAVKQTIKSYAISDKNLLNQIKEYAKEKAEAYNIDANKFCCEADSVEEYEMYDIQGPISRKRISDTNQIPD